MRRGTACPLSLVLVLTTVLMNVHVLGQKTLNQLELQPYYTPEIITLEPMQDFCRLRFDDQWPGRYRVYTHVFR